MLERPTAVDVASIPVTTRAVETFDVDSTDFLVADDTYLYARREAGVVEVIDPRSAAVVRSVDLGGHEGQGIGVGFGAVWVGAPDGVARVDAEAGAVTAVAEVVKVREQSHLAAAFGSLWVLTGDGTELVALDPETAEVERTVGLSVRGNDLAASADALWIVSSVDDAVVAVSPESGAVEARAAVEEPRLVRIDGDVVWVATTFGVHRLDSIGRETGSVGLGADRDGGIAIAPDGAVWVRNARSVLHRIDPETLEVTERVDLPLAKGGSVDIGFGFVWASAYDEAEALLFRVAL